MKNARWAIVVVLGISALNDAVTGSPLSAIVSLMFALIVRPDR